MIDIHPVSYLRIEYERRQALFNAQPPLVQRFVEAQGRQLAEALMGSSGKLSYSLPDRVVVVSSHGEQVAMLIPAGLRNYQPGGWRGPFHSMNLRDEIRESLTGLEQSPDRALAAGAALLRHACAVHMVYRMLPEGRAVVYLSEYDEQTPSMPAAAPGGSAPAITQPGDAIVEDDEGSDPRRVQVPYVSAALRFFLPQWVAFDGEDRLLAGSIKEAEANQASMEKYIDILHAASSLAPYMVADDMYQRKRYGILGQAVNQGRALARFMTRQIIRDIRNRVENHLLNRGLTISMPFYDDQKLRMRVIEIEVIPAGRIPFKPLFMTRAARLESAKVEQDTRLNSSTRRHALQLLDMLEHTFVIAQTQAR